MPVVTYGFDKSFLDFFGTNGVAAVESAIKILNDLPPASQIVLTNYPLKSWGVDAIAEAHSLVDLKFQALFYLVEQLGLDSPYRNTYVLHSWDPEFFYNDGHGAYIYIVGIPITYESEGVDSGAIAGNPGFVTNYVAGYNFDPEDFHLSVYVDNTFYGGCIYVNASSGQNYIFPYLVDPLAQLYPAVADYNFGYKTGDYLTGLTRDDVGGLRYLLSTNNFNYEALLPDVVGIGSNANSFVNGAWRPGVDKITFVPQPTGTRPGTFLPMTNQFADAYVSGGNIVRQGLERVTTKPDVLFSAGNDAIQTGTTNWINNATLNNNPDGAGPGIIRPPVKIVFAKYGDY